MNKRCTIDPREIAWDLVCNNRSTSVACRLEELDLENLMMGLVGLEEESLSRRCVSIDVASWRRSGRGSTLLTAGEGQIR